jgi:hypothetical protein
MFYVILDYEWSIEKHLLTFCWTDFMFHPIFTYISLIPLKAYTLAQYVYVYLIHILSIYLGYTLFKWKYFF